MARSLAQLRENLARVKPWVAVAVLLAIALLGYYAVLGTRYFNASEQVASMNGEIRQLTAKLREPPLDEEALKAERESQKQQLEAMRSLFSHPKSDDLVGILSATAQETSVTLAKVAVADWRWELQGEIGYWTQPMTAMLHGETVDIYRFLSLLQQKVPVARVTSVNMSGLEAVPSAQVQVLFYLSPEATSGE